MIQFSFSEKMKTLFELVSSSPFFLFLIVFFILLGIVLFDTIKYEKRKIKKAYALMYLAIFLAIIIKYNTSLLQLLDYLVNNIFIILYYPNLAVYILMIIISNILVIRAVFKRDMTKSLKIINIIFYCMKMFMMIIILDNITKNEIDVYSQLSIYSNNQLTMLVEISSALFFIWLLLMFIIWMINKLTNVLTNDKKSIKVVEKIPNQIDNKQQKTNSNRNMKETKEDIFSTEDYIMMLNLIQLSKEDEYIKKKLEERVLLKDKE